MHVRRDRPLLARERFDFALVLTAVMLAAVAATCASCASAAIAPALRSPREQHAAGVLIKVACASASEGAISVHLHYGSGVIVGDHEVLTAGHVAHCDDNEVMAMTVDPGDGTDRDAELDVLVPRADVARITVGADLSKWFTPVRIGPVPQVGDRVCEVSAAPRWTYRCGVAQIPEEGTSDGDVHIEMTTEFGNSGSALYDADGNLVAIVVMVQFCQAKLPCVGEASSLAAYPWLIP
jgi:S1-C subfamily serine protease